MKPNANGLNISRTGINGGPLVGGFEDELGENSLLRHCEGLKRQRTQPEGFDDQVVIYGEASNVDIWQVTLSGPADLNKAPQLECSGLG